MATRNTATQRQQQLSQQFSQKKYLPLQQTATAMMYPYKSTTVFSVDPSHSFSDGTPRREEFVVRGLQLQDRDAMRELHERIFPIRYPDTFYNAATSPGSLLYTQCLIDDKSRLTAMIVARKRLFANVDAEDRDLLPAVSLMALPGGGSGGSGGPAAARVHHHGHARLHPSAATHVHQTTLGMSVDRRVVLYVLTIGVAEWCRHRGHATYLVHNLIRTVSNQTASQHICAVYLHVMTSNEAAIRFYEKLGFHRHKLLPKYYTIGGVQHDAYTYVIYIDSDDGECLPPCFDQCAIS
eukprot:m.202437 g.202437  ORF g.202437 m.202437 type:complete len:295 (-) comp18830_c0_seq1:305-1189(-)